MSLSLSLTSDRIKKVEKEKENPSGDQ